MSEQQPQAVEVVVWPSAVISLLSEGPRPPGETGRYGEDVKNSLAPEVYPTGKREGGDDA